MITKSSQIKDGAVSGADVRNATLTGRDVRNGSLGADDVQDGSLGAADLDLAKLGKVPAAATADQAAVATRAATADTADSANEVDGQHVERIAATVPVGASARVAGADGGLEVIAGCGASGELMLSARSTTAHAVVRASVLSAQPAPGAVRVTEDADLNPGEDLALDESGGSGTAQIAYLGADGRVTTAVMGFGELVGVQTCTVAGTLVRAG